MPITGKTRPFGAGPYGFAAFGTWRLDRAAGSALANGAAGGGVRRSRMGMGRSNAAGAAAGGALNPKVSGARAAGISGALGGAQREGVRGAHAVALSDMVGGAFAIRNGFGAIAAQSALRGRLRLLWDRPDDTPETPLWSPVAPGGSGPWQPIPMPGAPIWQPRQPAEY